LHLKFKSPVADTSGEVEFVLLSKPTALGDASAPTTPTARPRPLGVSLSKQLCHKPLPTDAWR